MADEERKEMPTLPEKQEPSVSSPQDERMVLLAELEKLGVKKPEQLTGMAVASEQSGKLANMLGEIRRENQELKRMLQEQQSRRVETQDPYGNPAPVDIGKVVEDAVGKFYQKNILEPQQRAQSEFQQHLQEVQEDDHYHILGTQFEQYVANPKVTYSLQTGQTSLAKEYRRFKDRYFTNLLGKVTENYKSLLETGAKPSGVKTPPHMESGESTNYVPPEANPDVKDKLKEVRAKSRGTEGDIDALLKVLLPDGDPILRRR